MAEWKASDIASQREMPKAHGRGVTAQIAEHFLRHHGLHLLLFPVLFEEAKGRPSPLSRSDLLKSVSRLQKKRCSLSLMPKLSCHHAPPRKGDLAACVERPQVARRR